MFLKLLTFSHLTALPSALFSPTSLYLWSSPLALYLWSSPLALYWPPAFRFALPSLPLQRPLSGVIKHLRAAPTMLPFSSMYVQAAPEAGHLGCSMTPERCTDLQVKTYHFIVTLSYWPALPSFCSVCTGLRFPFFAALTIFLLCTGLLCHLSFLCWL